MLFHVFHTSGVEMHSASHFRPIFYFHLKILCSLIKTPFFICISIFCFSSPFYSHEILRKHVAFLKNGTIEHISIYTLRKDSLDMICTQVLLIGKRQKGDTITCLFISHY